MLRACWKRVIQVCAVLVSVTPCPGEQQDASNGVVTTLRVNSRIVIVDVQMTDRAGKPIYGLQAKDVTVYEEGVPQVLRSFEEHRAAGQTISRQGPMVLVFDTLNTPAEDGQYARAQMQRYLNAQPVTLTSRTALMVLGSRGLRMLTDFTTSAAVLKTSFQAQTMDTSFKRANKTFDAERFGLTLQTLRQIALSSRGEDGRTNVIWVGQGFPTVTRQSLAPRDQGLYDKEVRSTMETLLGRRVEVTKLDTTRMDVTNDFATTKALISAGTPSMGGMDAVMTGLSLEDVNFGEDRGPDPFATGISFNSLALATGGRYRVHENDLAGVLAEEVNRSALFYTLSYTPAGDGSEPARGYRHLRVQVKSLPATVQSKRGYYPAGVAEAQVATLKETAFDMTEAAKSSMSYRGLDVKLLAVGPGTVAAGAKQPPVSQFALSVDGRQLTYDADVNGDQHAKVYVAAAAFDVKGKLLSYKAYRVVTTIAAADARRVNGGRPVFKVALPVAAGAARTRLLLRDESSGRMGSVDAEAGALTALKEKAAGG